MRKAHHRLFAFTCAVSLILCFAGIASSQSRDRFIISAKAGGINAVSGRAAVHGKGVSEWQQLTIKEDLESGDVVKTGADGRVEMLLNPGSYLRVGENSEFELANNSLDNLEVRLLRGTAIVEATGTDDMELLINITTPDAKLAIVRRGLYRLNVVPGDSTELIVRKGRVMLDGDSHTKIKGGNKVVFSSGSVSIAKLEKEDKKKNDGIDTWSKERAETVAKANSKMRRREINSLVFAMRDPFFPRRSGLWVFNRAFNCYTFIPLFYGWGSPYGSSYSRTFFGNPYWGNYGYGGVTGGGSSGGNGGGAGGSTGSSPTYNPPPRPMAPTPPAMERKIERLNDRMPNQP
jgi:hypothetical protein